MTAPLLREPAPAPYFLPLFLIFQSSPSRGGNQKLLPPPGPFKIGGGGGQTMFSCVIVKTNSNYTVNIAKRSNHLLSTYLIRDNTHITSMKIGQFSVPPTPCPAMSKILPPPDLERPIFPLPLQITTNQLNMVSVPTPTPTPL